MTKNEKSIERLNVVELNATFDGAAAAAAGDDVKMTGFDVVEERRRRNSEESPGDCQHLISSRVAR